MVIRFSRSVPAGRNWRQMFSVKVTLGASKVAEAVDLMADSSAPKNSTCITKGIFCSTSVGSTFCGSSFSSTATSSGMMRSALATRNIGTKANRM
ncbi:hypothetical protein FQZ97_771610 [compost metagenome]